MIEYTITAIISAMVGYIVPKALDTVTDKKQLSSKFPWVYWLVAHAAGGAVGGVLSAVLGVAGLNTPGGIGNWAVFGLCLGIAQWLALQRYLRLGPMWVVGSTLGWSLFSLFPYFEFPFPLDFLIGLISVGIAVGFLQWLVLRKTSDKAFWWIPANAVAWVSTFFIALILVAEKDYTGGIAWMFGWGLFSVLGSLITGLAMTRIHPTR